MPEENDEGNTLAIAEVAASETSDSCPRLPCPYCMLDLKHDASVQEIRLSMAQSMQEHQMKKLELEQDWTNKFALYQQVQILKDTNLFEGMVPPHAAPPPPQQSQWSGGKGGSGSMTSAAASSSCAAAATYDEPPVRHSGAGTYKGWPSWEEWATRRGWVFVVMVGKGNKMHYAPWEDDWQDWLEQVHVQPWGKVRIDVNVDGTKYDIDLEKWCQVNKESGTRRALGRMSKQEFLEYEMKRKAKGA